VSSTTGTGTGFLHLGNRWYSPPVEPNAGVGNQVGPGRFTQPDSTTQLDDPANGNLYAYAADSPTNYSDPTGASLLSGILGGTVFEILFTVTCGAVVLGVTGGAGAPLAEAGCFYVGSILAGYVGYEAGK
jgi:hypothetical protein